MRFILIVIVLFLIILIFWSLRGPLIEGKRKGTKRENEPEKIAQCMEILGLRPGASQEEATQAYRDMVNVWHPDRFANNRRLQRKAEEKIKEINAAYEYVRSFHRWR